MTDANVWPILLTLSAGLVGGVLLGLIYFRAVKITADLIVAGKRPVIAIALTLGRLGLMGAGLVLALQAGAIAVLAALVGVLIGRSLTLRRPRELDA